MRALGLGFAFLCLTVGCGTFSPFEEPKTATVSSNPFGIRADSRPSKVSYQPSDPEVATRVDSAGRKLLAANPELGLQRTLYFSVASAPQPEIFHTGQNMIWMTDSLVKKCPSEAELTALLALEVGKIIAEREAAVVPETRRPERLPPIQVSMGNAGQVTEIDQMREAELARFEREQPKKKRLPRIDPERLARGYLEKAGFQSADLDSVQPILRIAQANITLERQFKGNAANAWTP